MAKKLSDAVKAKTAEVSTSNFDRVSSVIADLNKHYGKKLIKTGDDIPKIKKVPFGEPALDYVSDGGIPIGRMTEFLGQEHCIAHNTYLAYQVRTKDGRIQNHKGGTVKSLYNKFHLKDKIHSRRNKTIDSDYFIQCVNTEDDSIFTNKIVDVYFNGISECFEVETESGKLLTTTGEHEYYVGDGKFEKLKNLSIGSVIYVYNGNKERADYTNNKKYKEIFIKGYHPHLGIKKVGTYEYYRGLEHRLVVEADLNSMSYQEYINFLNTESIEKIDALNFIPNGLQVHHKDDNPLNNDLSNLELLTLKEHNEVHNKNEHLKTFAKIDKIKSIKSVGKLEVYDLQCSFPHHNYIAQGIVVHNSGKTRNALRVMSKFQKYCFNCDTPDAINAVWELDKNNSPSLKSCTCNNCSDPKTNIQVLIDIEGTTDPLFMENFGIDVSGVIYVRPDMPSQAIGIVDTFLREPQIGLILLDSIGSMGADKEIENAIEDNKMNQNALFFNQAIRKWQMAFNSNTNETGKENGTTMIVINQSYVTLSIFSTEVAQGGRGLRHGKAMSLKTRIKERNKDEKTKKVFGVHVEYKNEKNKTGIPYRVKEYYLNLDPLDPSVPYCQTNTVLQYIELAIDMGVVQQRGGWFEFGGKKWQGKANLIDDFDDSIKTAVDEIIYKKENLQ